LTEFSWPWVYPYTEDPTSARRYEPESGRTVLRPVVLASLLGRHPMDHLVWGLVDSGSEHTLLAPWTARAIGLDPDDAVREIPIGIGGDTIAVGFQEVTLRLHPPGGSIDSYFEWESEVGFVSQWRASWSILFGQIGLFDHFTITMHRHAQALAVEPYDEFDRRFGTQIRLARDQPPRFFP
jgi:hypothetical protein